jgi:hypothetical protein
MFFRHQAGIRGPTRMIDVRHDAPAGGVDGRHESFEARDLGIVVDGELGWKLAPIAMNVERFAGQQAYSALRPPGIEGDVALRNLTDIRSVAQFDRRHHNAVGQGQGTDPRWL